MPRCEKRQRGHHLFHIPGWGAPRAFLSRPKKCPQVDHRAMQGRAGQGRAYPGHNSGPGKSHDCSVLLQVSQLLRAGGSMGWWGREGRGKRRGEVNRRPKREPVPCVQRTPAASGPRWVVVCVEMKLGGEWREGRVRTHF